jgi:hypothetical protein
VGVNKMTGLVLELQRDALNPEIKVSNLLRKAIVISKKLGIVEIEDWINKELNGYLIGDEVPQYRILYGEVKAFNPFNGYWMPVIFPTSELTNIISEKLIELPIIEIETLAHHNGQEMQCLLPTDTEILLMKNMNSQQFKPHLIIGKIKFIGILDAVRNKILDWSLELEQQGILGAGMSFSPEEKKLAHQTSYQITNHIGNMHNSQLQQDSAGATQSLSVTETNTTELKNFIEELKKAMDSLQLAQEQSQELNEAIAMLEIQVNSAKPNNVIIRESGRTVRNVLEGMTGSIIASGLIYQLELFLPV